jgi:4-amino-4-deoxy-L-arabinose transferase-like glycosyltransferase
VQRRTLAGLGALALVVRVVYAVAFMRGYTPDSDADSYYQIGRAVSKGHGYVFTLPFEFVHATAIRPPLFPTLLAGAFRIFGTHVGVAQGVNIVAGSAATVLGALLGARIAGTRAGLGAGIVVALYPPLIANDVTVLAESLAVVLLLTTVLLLVDGRTVLAGVALGLLMLDRASAQWFVVVIAVWVLSRMGWQHALRLAAIAFVVVSPWVVRNAVQVGGPVLVATNGFNLNATYSNEARESTSHFVDAYFDPRFAVLRAASSDEVDLDARLRTKALHDLRAHPGQLVRVLHSNVERWFELRPSLNRDAEDQDGRNLTVRDWTLPFFYLVTAAGIAALARARKSAAAQLLALAAAYFTLVCLVSVSVPRLRSVFDASLAIGAGVTLAWLTERATKVDERRPPVRPLRALRSALVLGVLAVLIVAAVPVWRNRTRPQAKHAIEAAANRDESAFGRLHTAYQATSSTRRPPQLDQNDLDQIHDLLAVLGDRAPQTDGTLHEHVVAALRAVRAVWHEADVIGLLSAGETIAASREHRPASLAAVRARYEQDIRPGDATLEPWDHVLSGAAILGAQHAIDDVRDGLLSASRHERSGRTRPMSNA